MSETTNSADFPIEVSVSITQTCGKPATEFEILTYAWHALGAKMRAAEGGMGNFTTTRAGNVDTASEAQTSKEIGTGCTGRKMALARMALCGFVIAFLLARVWNIGGVEAALLAIGVVVWVDLFRIERASGEGAA